MNGSLIADGLLIAYERALETLASVIEERNLESGLHIKRTMELTGIMIERLAQTDKYRDELQPEMARLIIKAIPLHDIGKIGISDNILLKPGKLSPEEFEIIKSHTVIGSDIIDSIAKDIENDSGYLKSAREICRSHHERWDGKGYPDGLRGDEIPVSARILAIADVYDALVSVRCYKAAYTHSEALHIMKQGHKTQFDPDILDLFFDAGEEIKKVAIPR